MTVMGEGKAPGVEQLRALGMKNAVRNADRIIDQVQSAVSRWQAFADQGGVTVKSAKLIGAKIAPPAMKGVAAKPKATKGPIANEKSPPPKTSRASKKRK